MDTLAYEIRWHTTKQLAEMQREIGIELERRRNNGLNWREIAQAGDKIGAIKKLRDVVPGLGLYDAKCIVEEHMDYATRTAGMW